jgi:tetratricopeptide (TPR) repeat protein
MLLAFGLCALSACSTVTERGTLAELEHVEADLREVHMEEGLKRAVESYRRYLAETSESTLTPEAMRRLADLQIEQAYGLLGTDEIVEMAAPESAVRSAPSTTSRSSAAPGSTESQQDFEELAPARAAILAGAVQFDAALPEGASQAVPAGPREAIETYRKILEKYPNYERNDQVLYQMSRAYGEIGQPDKAMAVADRLVAAYPYSKYIDEIQFRRGEYYFVRKKFLDAEEAYKEILDRGRTSPYYELALYKLGWTLYKQELYEDALQNYIAMLDHLLANGFDFDKDSGEEDEVRVADTFRVISLSFSNLGGPEVVDNYFSVHGHRSYADKIYKNLAEFYFTKLRYQDAASVYKSFIRLNPFHKHSPRFSMRMTEIYSDGGFPRLVVESKKEFATSYAKDAEYWQHYDFDDSPEIVGFLKTNLTDLANHYHSLYQDENLVDEKPANFAEALHWYQEFLTSFPTTEESPTINYQLADLFLENEDFSEAATEYERTAYEYASHDQAAKAGYAAIFAHRKDLELVSGARKLAVKEATVASSLKFADTFPDHEQAPAVLGTAAEDLYDMKKFGAAIKSAQTLVGRYPKADASLLRSAWGVIANSSIDLAEFENAEGAYMRLLALTPAEDESRQAVVDGLAAAIYKQGERAMLLEDYRAAADHYLRIKDAAPTSDIRTVAEYDAAAALIKLEDWAKSAEVLEEFRASHPEHELNTEVTKQLAHVYLEDGKIKQSATEHEKIAAESTDPELRRAALLTAGDLYDQAKSINDAVRIYEQYVAAYPRPLDIAMETRFRLAEIFKAERDTRRYQDKLRELVQADATAGNARTDRSRFLAAKAALALSEPKFHRFAELRLKQPFEKSLAEKQRRMDVAMNAFERLVDYEVAEVTAAATFYIAEIYSEFGKALMSSERPSGLSDAEMIDYESVIEEEAYPFEEQAIGTHEENFELLAAGVYNPWVQKSLDRLAALMPGRYAKHEISGGFLKSIETYAYRMPRITIEKEDTAEVTDTDPPAESIETMARAPSSSEHRVN